MQRRSQSLKRRPKLIVRRGYWIALVVLVGLVAANFAIELPYFILSPGDARPVAKYVELPDNKSQGQSGKILLATVSLIPATPFDWLLAHVTPGAEIEKKKEVLGPKTTQSEYIQLNQEAMDDSQLTAISVAMKRVGYKAIPLGDGAQVAAIGDATPATGKLNINDVVTAINGQRIGVSSELVDTVQALKVGDVIHLDVTRADKQSAKVDITLGSRPETGLPYVGVALQTVNARLDTPFPVGFKATDIGGPSAGLAFTLTLIDELTPGELTGGQTIATTGTIESDGTVGQVGGVKQKTRAVQAAGAKIFLVPTGEYQDAKNAAGSGLTVIPVNDIEDALKALATHGGDASGVPAAA